MGHATNAEEIFELELHETGLLDPVGFI